MDLSDKSSECDDSSCLTRTSDRVSSDASTVKSCVDCGTSKTPLWRVGPAGPKSLCNACGIKSRKKRRALVGVTAEDCDAKTTNKSTASIKHSNDHINNIHSSDSCTSSSRDSTTNPCSLTEKKRLLWCSFGRSLQRPRSSSNRRRKMKEEEEAAFLLMALSSGSVYA